MTDDEYRQLIEKADRAKQLNDSISDINELLSTQLPIGYVEISLVKSLTDYKYSFETFTIAASPSLSSAIRLALAEERENLARQLREMKCQP